MSQVTGVFVWENILAQLTDDWAPARLRRCGTSCGGWWRWMGLGNQAEGRLLLVVVVVVVYTQVHGEDGCSCGGHLHGQCCCAHVHWKMRQTSQAKDYNLVFKQKSTTDQQVKTLKMSSSWIKSIQHIKTGEKHTTTTCLTYNYNPPQTVEKQASVYNYYKIKHRQWTENCFCGPVS